MESNILEWTRSWKDYKITEFPTEFRVCLRSGQRKTYDIDIEFEELACEPELPIGKDYWVPTQEQCNRLNNMTELREREYEEKVLYNQWVEERQEHNATTRTKNDTMKKVRDEIKARGGNMRQDMISTLMGAAIKDMTLDSQQRVKTWIRKDASSPDYDANTMATNLDNAYQMLYLLFIFEAAMATHVKVVSYVDECTLLQRQVLQIVILKNLKHESGSLEAWMRKLKDQIRVCGAVKCTLTDVHYKTYFMENLNTKIFEDILQIWHNEVIRKNVPKTHSEIKEYVLNDYLSQTTREERMKIIIGVVSKAWSKTPASNEGKSEKTELPMNGQEEGCSLCGLTNHVLDKCFHYDKSKSIEEIERYMQQR